MLPAPAAEMIDHTAPQPTAPKPGVTAEYGEYIAGRGCADCHGTNYAGSSVPGGLPAPNLTPAGSLANWSEEDFIASIRSGFTPDGRQLDSKEMPWPTYSMMTDEELQAVCAPMTTTIPGSKQASPVSSSSRWQSAQANSAWVYCRCASAPQN